MIRSLVLSLHIFGFVAGNCLAAENHSDAAHGDGESGPENLACRIGPRLGSHNAVKA